MSFLQPERVPVKLYRFDDPNAPQLDGTSDSLLTVLKACLVTGYGDKLGAGWSLPFEDADNGIKVFRPELSVHLDYFVHVSQDTGKEATFSILTDMTNINNGIVIAKTGTSFKHHTNSKTGREWIVIASSRSFWLFRETANNNNTPKHLSGAYLFCGDTAQNELGFRAVFLKHTGGTWGIDDDDRYFLFESNDPNGSVAGKLYCPTPSKVIQQDAQLLSMFIQSSQAVELNASIICDVLVYANREAWRLPCYHTPSVQTANRTIINSPKGRLISHGTGSIGRANVVFVPIDFWEY